VVREGVELRSGQLGVYPAGRLLCCVEVGRGAVDARCS
jgi:hypothetical protein